MSKSNRKNRRSYRQDSYDPIPQLFELMARMTTRITVVSQLADIAENMTRKMRASMPPEYRDQVDDDYVTRFACAVYYAAISVSDAGLQEAQGVINAGWNFMSQMPDKCSPVAMVKMFQEGFGELSPTMAAAITEDIIIKTAKLLLSDWAENGEPDAETLKYDTHFYFHEMLQLSSNVDSETMRREGANHILNLPPEALAKFDPAMIQTVRDWKNAQTGE